MYSYTNSLSKQFLSLIVIAFIVLSCGSNAFKNKRIETIPMQQEMLNQLDKVFFDQPTTYYPTIDKNDIKYSFFLNLEHGSCFTAGSKIHLYSDTKRWAIVFEKSGYQTGNSIAEIELSYIGNCIDYCVEKTPERNYISNMALITLIAPTEFERITNKEGTDMETFELIAPNTPNIMVRDTLVSFEKDYKEYEKLGITVREEDNPNKLIGFPDFVRYLNETNPSLISAKESEVKAYIPKDLAKILTISDFHYSSKYDTANPPSKQELFQLIAKILTTGNPDFWKPVLKPNNHWKNWDSGFL